jgi:hypothetical protein
MQVFVACLTLTRLAAGYSARRGTKRVRGGSSLTVARRSRQIVWFSPQGASLSQPLALMVLAIVLQERYGCLTGMTCEFGRACCGNQLLPRVSTARRVHD